MEPLQRAYKVLGDAERELRKLITQAMEAQKYDHVGQIARLAEGLAELQGGKLAGSHQAVEQKPRPTANRLRAKSSKSTTKSKGAYPRFEREGDKLIKVGWSKKAREEYEHRAPRSAALAFVKHVDAHTEKGTVFTIDELWPVLDAAGEELPSYQVYLALAWLRHAGAVEKQGRDGYAMPNGTLDADGLNALWDSLPTRSV